ncbi:hypothetical protein MCP_2200 [Methanocella paludicola SANAE]|uniref:Uncharacterized protein n=1 Tax=Methanocella paludicola (strain DSM 17711 / JCM 13418 / NBRC 101707 / SANAE) TaxID=304371 RepID=D1Z0Q0_METPS|nr:hypothetical protein [Methanocella paludicola]BAI62272.1 hypothetical protein MCP_2200 [Methanocella paludicola SANAE]
MRAITKIVIALLAVSLLAAAIPQVSARSDSTKSTSSLPPSSSDLFNLKGHNYLNYHKLIQELNKIERSVIKYYEKQGAVAATVGSVDKTITRNPDGTFHVTLYVTVPAGLYANVYDYLTNLVPIPGTFTPIQPNVVRDNYVEWDGLPAGSYVLQFDARQVLGGFYGDQVFVHAYGFGAPGGFIFGDRRVGFWFDI